MGINRDSRHKRRLTGGRMPIHKKKRAFEKARPLANTRLTTDKDDVRIREVRTRGGNRKYRALRLNEGNFSWPSEGVSHKTKIVDVVYNASDNDLVRTKTLVKNCIVTIDSTPFRQWFLKHYGQDPVKNTRAQGKEDASKSKDAKKDDGATKQSSSVKRKLAARQKNAAIDQKLGDLFSSQRLFACISSRPGQSGRADGYILEGRELEFYLRKLDQKRK